MNSRQRTNLIFFVLVVIAVIAIIGTRAYASPPDNRPPDNRPPERGATNVTITNDASAAADSVSEAAADSWAEANAQGGSATAEGGSASVNVNIGGGEGVGSLVSDTSSTVLEGGDTTINQGDTNFNSESNNINTVLVPNNNTSGCMRVYGFSFGNGEGAGALGVPFRDKACDYELAADDAAASGQHDIAWFWRCHKKHLYQPYRQRGESEEDAIAQCFDAMLQMLTPPVSATAPAPVYMMAELSDEEAAELKAKIAELETELAEREARIEEYEQTQQEIQQQQKQQIQQNDELLEQLRRDAERRRKALAALEKKEA